MTLPPVASGLPIVGQAVGMYRDFLGLIVEQYKALGPVFRLQAFNRKMIVMAGPEANVFVSDAETQNYFSSRETWSDFGREFGAVHYIQNIDGAAHRDYRKRFKNHYSASMMLQHLDLLVSIQREMMDCLDAEYAGQATIGMYTYLQRIVSEQLGRVLTGTAVGEDLEYFKKFARIATSVHVTKMLPAWLLHTNSYLKARERILGKGIHILNHRKKNNIQRGDLVNLILAIQNDDPAFFKAEGDMIVAALGPFIAGLDTVANALTSLVYELVSHPSIMELCQFEADELFDEDYLVPERLAQTQYIDDVIKETLRLHPIAPAIVRTAACEFEFAGYTIPKNTEILISTATSHFLPELYREPHSFDIKRYLPPRNEHKTRGAFAPFGVGPHICLGAGSAEMQIKVDIATLLHYRTLQWTPRTLKPSPLPPISYGDRLQIGLSAR